MKPPIRAAVDRWRSLRNWMRQRERVLGLAFIVVGLVALTWALEILIQRNATAWVSAIQAVSTITLVVVTAWYVFLTRALVRSQERAARVAGQEAAMRELSRLLGQE